MDRWFLRSTKRSKHHSAHKKPLSQDAQKPLSQHAQKKEVMMLTRWAMRSKSKTWTVCSKFVPSAPILNRDLQLSTMTSNSQPWAPIINHELQFWTLCSTGPTLKFTKTSKLNWTVQNESRQCPNTLVIFIIYYYMLYVFYFYYLLFYIICILFLLYVILYYINFHNSIRIFLLYPNLNKEPSH